jgi:polyisoprenoid-binding protein YceI
MYGPRKNRICLNGYISPGCQLTYAPEPFRPAFFRHCLLPPCKPHARFSSSLFATRFILALERNAPMKWLAFAAGVLLLTGPSAVAQVSTWRSDPAKSQIQFTVRHLAMTDVHGRIGHITAIIRYDAVDVTKSDVTATIGVDTITTGEAGRDDEIKGADFFDVDHFPRAAFTSTQVSRNGDGLWVHGNLTLHGITRPVILNVRGPDKPVMGPDGKPHSGFSATTTLDRTAFEIGSTFPAAIVGDLVKLTIRLDIIKQ